MTTTLGYQLVEDSNRVYATDGDGREICGAHQPAGHSYWQLYVSRLVSEATGLRTPPHREHFWGDHGKQDSMAWVELIAALYTRREAAA